MEGLLPAYRAAALTVESKLLLSIVAEKRIRLTAIASLAAYVVLYLAATEHLVVLDGAAAPSLQILPDWQDLVFRQRAPFLFEPVGAVYLGPLALYLSVPNLMIAFVLGVLVAANVAVSYYGFRTLGMRGLQGLRVLIGTIPALISGAACCVPTLILVIGLQLTATLATVWSLLLPISAVLLLASFWWSLHRLAEQSMCDSRHSPARIG